jgi:hypothetical protein
MHGYARGPLNYSEVSYNAAAGTGAMRWLILAILLTSGTSLAETWRWVDENGVVNYSDQPHPGAERVDLRSVQTYTAPEWTQRPAASGGDDSENGAASGDISVNILRPQPEETLWNIEGSLEVLVDVQPAPERNASMVFYLDGTKVPGAGGAGATFVVTSVYRGTHTLRAAMETSGGEEIAVSPTVRFFVNQTTLDNPNNPNRPGAPGVRPPIVRPPITTLPTRPTPRSGG